MKGREALEGSTRLLEEDINISWESPWDQWQASSAAGKRKQELPTHSPNIFTFLDVLSNTGPARLQLKFWMTSQNFFFWQTENRMPFFITFAQQQAENLYSWKWRVKYFLWNPSWRRLNSFRKCPPEKHMPEYINLLSSVMLCLHFIAMILEFYMSNREQNMKETMFAETLHCRSLQWS